MTSHRQQSNDVHMKDNTNNTNNTNSHHSNNSHNSNNSNNNTNTKHTNSYNPNNTHSNSHSHSHSHNKLKRGKKRFSFKKVLAKTLQGRIYYAVDRNNKGTDKQWVIVKECWKELVKTGKSRDGHNVPEDFPKEKKLHKYLSDLAPKDEIGFVRCIEDWEDDHCYYLAMEFCGGGELFDWISNQHSSGPVSSLTIKASTMTQIPSKIANEWQLRVQSMFRQLVKTVSFFHRNNIVHLDLSLENTMLGNNKETKIIDFGLSQLINLKQNCNFKFSKRVGKTGYMAPEVFNKQIYDARLADIWSLGVMLFMMLIGAPPYEYPNKSNPAFNFIISGRLKDVLKHWKRLPMITEDALDLLNKIFVIENKRINMKQLRLHKYVSLGFEPKPEYITINNTYITEPMDGNNNNNNTNIENMKHTISNNNKDNDGDNEMIDKTNTNANTNTNTNKNEQEEQQQEEEEERQTEEHDGDNNNDTNTNNDDDDNDDREEGEVIITQEQEQAPDDSISNIKDLFIICNNGKKKIINCNTNIGKKYLYQLKKENIDLSKININIIREIQKNIENKINQLNNNVTYKTTNTTANTATSSSSSSNTTTTTVTQVQDDSVTNNITYEAGQKEQSNDIKMDDIDTQNCIKELEKLNLHLQEIMTSTDGKLSGTGSKTGSS